MAGMPYRSNSKYKELSGYRQWLMDAGFAIRSVRLHLRAAETYLKLNRPLTQEAVTEWKQEMLSDPDVPKKTSNDLANCASRYILYLQGEPCERARRKTRSKKYFCGEDCFNCIYPDCIIY